MSNNNKLKLDECPLPAVIKKDRSPSSHQSCSSDQSKNLESPIRRTRASSWDDSDDETSKPQTDKMETDKEINENDGKSQDNPDRRQSPARIRRRRRSSSGSSIISENALDERVINEIRQVGDIIQEKVENLENFEIMQAEIKKEEKMAEERILVPKKLPPVDPNQKKSCANPEILQELSKNINNMFFGKGSSPNKSKGKRKDQGKDLRAKSSDFEKRKKEKYKFPRPESEKIVRNDKSRGSSVKLPSPKVLDEVTIVEEIGNRSEVEFQTVIVPKNEERPKSASFLIMEDLEDVDENEIYKKESKKTSRTDRTKSAGASSINSYQWKASEKSSSCGIEYLTSGESSGSKISDIHNWSGRESESSPKRSYDSERWCHNFIGSQRSFSRTEKSPYSERGQLTSPTDSNEKSVDSEYTVKKTKTEIDPNPSKSDKSPHKDLFFPPETNLIGLGDSRNVQCWNVGKPEIPGIEEPQDHGDGNFRQLTNEKTWQELISQVEENRKVTNQFRSLQENSNKPDNGSWILNAKDEKFKKRDGSQSPKKSKWSLVGGTVAKPMSSSSDASTQCTILQDKKPSSRKRKREQLAKSRIIREEVVIERQIPLENEKIVKKISTPKKKEVTFDYNEITICEKEESNEMENYLILRKSREKQTTDYKNFLAKSEGCESRLKSKNDFRKKLQLWKLYKKDDNIKKCEKNVDDKTKFYHCVCFEFFCRIMSSFFKTGR